jgi:hypothetical protein
VGDLSQRLFCHWFIFSLNKKLLMLIVNVFRQYKNLPKLRHFNQLVACDGLNEFWVRSVVVLLCLSTGRLRQPWLIGLLLVLIFNIFWFLFASMMSSF